MEIHPFWSPRSWKLILQWGFLARLKAGWEKAKERVRWGKNGTPWVYTRTDVIWTTDQLGRLILDEFTILPFDTRKEGANELSDSLYEDHQDRTPKGREALWPSCATANDW